MTLKSKVPVNLENYPALKNLANTDKDQFLQVMKGLFTLADEAVQNNQHNASKTYFNLPLHDLIKQLTGAMFDYRGMIDYLPNKQNAEALQELYGMTLNPLYAAFTKENMLNTAGEPVTFEEKFGMTDRDFTVKDWLQGLLFFSYYCSLPDLARYFALDDYVLVDEERHKNISKLLDIRPVLDYQKRIGILPGKLIKGTGFFEAGDIREDVCPACLIPDTLEELKDLNITICTSCRGGFTHEG